MSFPKYPAYKDSGVEWLGEVPEHWEVSTIKRNYSILGGSTPKSEVNDYWDGEICWITPADLSRLQSEKIHDSIRKITSSGLNSCGANLVPVGSIVLSTRAPIGSIGIAAIALCTNQGCKSLVPHQNQESRFLAYFLGVATSELNIRGKGTTFLELSADELGAFRAGMPPQEEQKAIANFLDRETAKIDALVAEQAKLVALLKEKRQSVISHAVTQGLDPSVPMKNSGVEWLGKVPAHWKVRKIKQLTSRISSGKTPLGGNETYLDEGVLFLRSQNVYDDGLRLDDAVFISEETHQAMVVSAVQPNDILLNITGASIGRSCLVPREFPAANVNQHVCVVRLVDEEAVPFIAWFFKSDVAKNQIDLAQNGAAREGLNFEQIGAMVLPLPNAKEQFQIQCFLDAETAKLDALTAEAQSAITLLQERRTALISAAVTGQIDVRQLATA